MKKLQLFTKLIFISLLISSCKDKNSDTNSSTVKKYNSNKTKKELPLPHTQQLYHYSSTNNKKYDHAVTGVDEEGRNVNGVINLENEIGIGIIKADKGNEIEIISEQINSNRIIATDANGFIYRLKID